MKTTADADTYYQVGPDEINIIEETGEIIFGENVYNTLKQADDIVVDYAKINLKQATSARSIILTVRSTPSSRMAALRR